MAVASSSQSSEVKQVRSPRESLLNAAWERRRGCFIRRRCRSINNSSTAAAAKQASHSMQRSMSLASGLATFGDRLPTPCTHVRSLTDDDFEELKGCIELGFIAFDDESIPELAHILPALPACYALHLDSPKLAPSPAWDIFKPDYHPHDVKEQLRHWAQAVACNIKISYQEQQSFQGH